MDKARPLMKVSILGCGWFGTALSKMLTEKGHTVKGSTTHSEKLDGTRTHHISLNSVGDSITDPDFFDCDIMIVANNVRMNDEAYLKRTNFTIELIRKFNIPKVIFISSTSIYGEPNAIVDETTLASPETLSAKLLLKAERLFQGAPFNTTILRFAGLIGPGRDPGRFFAGKTNIPNGLGAVNLLHLDDAVSITLMIIETTQIHPIINVVSPDHPTRMDFYAQASRKSGLLAPIFIIEKKQWKIVQSIFKDYRYSRKLLS